MSYNITSWKIKKLENFKIPLDKFFIHERKDWHPEKPILIDASTNKVEINCGCEQVIMGFLIDGVLTISDLEMIGDGSGTFFRWIFEPAIKYSTGILDVVIIWEGGDSIQNLHVENGEVFREEIDL